LLAGKAHGPQNEKGQDAKNHINQGNDFNASFPLVVAMVLPKF
jgi:hypothetical protein